MKGLTTFEMWLFIGLYGVLAIVYLRYGYETISFWIKEKPKKPVYKWSFPKPISRNQSIQQLLVAGGSIVLMLCVLQITGNGISAVLFAGFLFGYFRLKREFHIKVYVTKKEVVVWSVFPNEEQTLWKGVISQQEWKNREETEKGYMIYTKEGVFHLKCRKTEKQKLQEKIEKTR